MTDAATKRATHVEMPIEPSEGLIETFRDVMAHLFGLHTTPEEARRVIRQLVQQAARENAG